MKKSFIICLAIVGGMFACACSDNAIDFGCTENNNHCDTENGIDVCYICAETVSGGRQWVKEICFYGKSEDGNSCKQFCATEWDDVNKQCIKVANCFLDSNELDGSCKKVDGCNKHKIDGSCECYKDKQNDDGTCEKTKNCVLEQWNEDGSCKRIENCVQAKWNEDGSCTPIADCVKGNSLDGKCNMIEGCAIGNNLDGSCIKVPDCFIKDENGNNKNANDGSCEKVVGCTAWYSNGTCMGCENGLNEDSGQCKCPDECTNGCEANGACKCSEAITCVTGCDIHTGNCTCPPTCAAGCHEDGSCKTPGSCATDNDCLVYSYCTDSSPCYCEQRNSIPTGDNREKGKCYFKDSNHNNMYDYEETLYWNETECEHNKVDCATKYSPASFCDSFIDYHCSTKCTDTAQCLPGFICREDGRCSADSFTTVWSSELRKETLEFNVSKEDAGVYICWDWKEIDKDNDEYCTVDKCECKTEECKSRTKDIQFHIPTEDELKKYPEFKWATCPVPFQYIEKANKDKNQNKYDVYIINHKYKEDSNYHRANTTDDITVKVYGELNGFSVNYDETRYCSIEGVNKYILSCSHLDVDGNLDNCRCFDADTMGIKKNKDDYIKAIHANKPNCLKGGENSWDGNCKEEDYYENQMKDDESKRIYVSCKDSDCSDILYFDGSCKNCSIRQLPHGSIYLQEVTSFGRIGLGTHIIDNTQYSSYYYDIKHYRGAFANCYHLTKTSSIDIPDSNKLDMTAMFRSACSFNYPIQNWDTSSVISLSRAFEMSKCQPGGTGGEFEHPIYPAFNQPLGKWDVSSVKTMSFTFECLAPFNQPLNDWDVSNVTSMARMFSCEDNKVTSNAFDQPLTDWDVSSVSVFVHMFRNAHYFNQDLSKWKISKWVNYCNKFNDICTGDTVHNIETYYNEMFLHTSMLDCNKYPKPFPVTCSPIL